MTTNNLPKIVVLTGAGISAESGIRTFRASDGLWENHPIQDVATPEGFMRNPELVQQFYNERRRQLLSPEIKPNAAHSALAKLEEKFGDNLLLVTQNVDNLHERAGSKNIIHMHGELLKVRCVYTDIDMDNVLVNFQTGIAKLDEETRVKYQRHYDEVPHIFSKMEPIKGALEAVNQLAEHYDIYALSTAPWNNPTAWSDKIEWIQKHFGKVLYKRLILSHHKNLNKGDLLIDDRLRNGVEQFEGEHLHFGVKYKNWQEVTDYLLDKSTLERIVTTRSKKLISELNFRGCSRLALNFTPFSQGFKLHFRCPKVKPKFTFFQE